MFGRRLLQPLAHLRAYATKSAAGLVAVAAIVVAGLPQPAAAQGIFPGTFTVRGGVFYDEPPPPPPWAIAPYTINFTRLDCLSESAEWGSDEPYVLFFVIDLRNPEQTGTGFRTSVFSNVDSDESRAQTVAIRSSQSIPNGNPDNLLVLTQVVEHDDSNVDQVLGFAGHLRGKVAANVRAGHSRDVIVSRAKDDMHELVGQLSVVFLHGPQDLFTTLDDRVARPQEVRFTTTDMSNAFNGTPAQTATVSDGGGDGRYRSHFELRHG